MSAIERLLEQLKTGWAPKRDEINPDIKQVDMYGWEVLENIKEDGIPNF
jgi:hypothetical protein